MFGSSSTDSTTLKSRYRGDNPRWIGGLLAFASAGLLLMLCGFYLLPEVARIQTTFYLTLLLPTLLLLGWRRDFGFLYSWQFAVFCGLPLLLAISALWAPADGGDVRRDFPFYMKLVAYLALFYCALYLVLEHRGQAQLQRWLLWLIPVGTLSCIASLVHYGLDGGFEHLRRIGGISLDGDIDKTAMLYGFHSLFCCYGISRNSRRWKLLSWSGLAISCFYVLLSQTKVPIVMGAAAVVLAALVSGSRMLRIAVALAFVAAPLGYMVIFGDLPLMHRSTAYSIRLELWGKAYNEFLQSPLIGSGMMYKWFLDMNVVLPHPHNYLLDIARFSGLLGVAFALAQLFAAAQAARNPRDWFQWVPGLFIAWFGFGLLAMLVYAQQPLVRPSYIWFYYWIPLAVLLVLNQLSCAERRRAAATVAGTPTIAESHG
ncbi:O-antigen ligase family protein [Microbulbifer hainanensis]|uniref:O-antigen ligase family protein n=1 Tax=Microbulbifer hainanensis TaxID=2735675 RepID=UPI001868DD43|nr:O-antigen ligase family protein [Microbulbifer hainanensis]